MPAATGFTREPAAGAPATEATEVRVAFTPATLYIGIQALDSEPRAITAKEMRNDAQLWQDDAVAILLDTFLDRRKNEEAYWSPIPLEADIWRFSLAGRLTGLDGISPGLNLRAKPFAMASGREEIAAHQDLRTAEDIGLDVKWGVGRGLALDLTVNTDFAESEVDEQQVNLSRFSLFLPEKREFFLENAGIFEFGPRSGPAW